MLRLTNSFKKLVISNETLAVSYVNHQTVRWRKPRWVPKAKTKMFKIPPRCETPLEERLELMRLYNNYRTVIKSLRRYFTYKYCTSFQTSTDPEEINKKFEEDFIQCMKINDEWNSKKKELREAHFAKVLEENLDFARKRLELEMIKEEEKVEAIEELVRKEKEAAKTFILPENVDAAIDYALENPIDYNFALNIDGEKIVGRENNGKEPEKINVKQ